MNWQIPNLLAQSEQTIRERLEATQLPDTKVPDAALERTGTSNPFATDYWFPEQASSWAGQVDFLYMAIFWISLIFFVGIVAVMVYFCIKYRRKGDEIETEPSSSHNTAIEILWSVIPSIILVWIFYVGADGYFKMRIEKENAEEIQVKAYQFGWLFTYPDGDSSNELHLVMDRPTKLIMQSSDVLHSLFVPAFRQKMDVVPGRYTYCYLEPTKPGVYRLSCNEYCGEGHSKMRTIAEVHTTNDARKKENPVDRKPITRRRKTANVFTTFIVLAVTKLTVKRRRARLLIRSGGAEEKLIDGSTVKVDENYVLESIWKPDAKIVEGYGPVSKMNSFQNLLDQEDVTYIIEFLKDIKE